jgi:glutamine amidotransferase
MIGVIDYGAGNLRSVCNALERLGIRHFVSDTPAHLAEAKKLILPGVGHAAAAMAALDQAGLSDWLRQNRKPLLGICLGMQLLFETSEEGDSACLGLIAGSVRRFQSATVGRVPHTGWNRVEFFPSFASQSPDDDFYFVHSYYCQPRNQQDWAGITDYNGQKFCSVVARDHLLGVQFHPEKSGSAGEALLAAFCR